MAKLSGDVIDFWILRQHGISCSAVYLFRTMKIVLNGGRELSYYRKCCVSFKRKLAKDSESQIFCLFH
jgi:hypothetical protein